MECNAKPLIKEWYYVMSDMAVKNYQVVVDMVVMCKVIG